MMRLLFVALAAIVMSSCVIDTGDEHKNVRSHVEPRPSLDDDGDPSGPRVHATCDDVLPGARVLATDDDDVDGVAVAGSWVYWMSRATTTSSPGNIMRTRRSGGGAAELVADAGGNPGYFAQDGALLAFADYDDGGDVVAIDTSVEPPTTSSLARGRTSPLFMALHAGSAFFSDGGGARIVRADIASANTTTAFETPNDSVEWMTRDAAFLYWLGLAGGAGLAISRAPLVTLESETPSDAVNEREIVAAVSWGNAGPLLVTDDAFFTTDDIGRLIRINRTNGSESVFGESAYRTAMDATRIYWSDPGNFADTGSIRARSFVDDDAPEEMLVEHLALPYTVAVDDCAVYWVDLTDLTVNMVAK